MLAQAGGSSAALAALSDQLMRAGYLPANGGSSSALQLQVRPAALVYLEHGLGKQLPDLEQVTGAEEAVTIQWAFDLSAAVYYLDRTR